MQDSSAPAWQCCRVSDRLHLATSHGLAFLVLAFHFAMGPIAIVAGFIAVAARKGGAWHSTSGVVFGDDPAGMMFFLGTVLLLAAIGAFRMMSAGGIHGARRLARHLWRMCFSLFIASGSFFLGQMKFIPERIRFVPLIVGLSVGPLVVLLYWMWRVRLRHNLRGLLTTTPILAKPPA